MTHYTELCFTTVIFNKHPQTEVNDMNNALEQAKAKVEGIVELIRADDAESIYEHPLTIEYRSGWTVPGHDMEPGEFRVVLCTGGPHVELLGAVGDDHVRVIWRIWGESGEYFPTSEEQDALQQYVTALGIHDTY